MPLQGHYQKFWIVALHFSVHYTGYCIGSLLWPDPSQKGLAMRDYCIGYCSIIYGYDMHCFLLLCFLISSVCAKFCVTNQSGEFFEEVGFWTREIAFICCKMPKILTFLVGVLCGELDCVPCGKSRSACCWAGRIVAKFGN